MSDDMLAVLAVRRGRSWESENREEVNRKTERKMERC
jgi:hypothetical protein